MSACACYCGRACVRLLVRVRGRTRVLARECVRAHACAIERERLRGVRPCACECARVRVRMWVYVCA